MGDALDQQNPEPQNAQEDRQVVLSVRDLTVGFGNKLVLDKLNLEIYRGEILGFVDDEPVALARGRPGRRRRRREPRCLLALRSGLLNDRMQQVGLAAAGRAPEVHRRCAGREGFQVGERLAARDRPS